MFAKTRFRLPLAVVAVGSLSLFAVGCGSSDSAGSGSGGGGESAAGDTCVDGDTVKLGFLNWLFGLERGVGA
jgi:hypothetical protein